MQIRLFL